MNRSAAVEKVLSILPDKYSVDLKAKMENKKFADYFWKVGGQYSIFNSSYELIFIATKGVEKNFYIAILVPTDLYLLIKHSIDSDGIADGA